jgi:hypothetical protein
MPEDFSLGPLQSYKPAQGDEAAVLKVARAFMDGIAAGKPDKELLLPEVRDALSLLLAPSAPPSGSAASSGEAKELAYRLGAIVLGGEDASLRVRLPSTQLPADGTKAARVVRQEGLLSLRKSGDSWYIEALALGPPESEALVFAPEALRKTK